MTRKALIFHGGWDGHEPGPCSGIVEALLAAEGMEVTRVEGTAILATADLRAFDLIVPVMTMAEVEKAEVAALGAAVEAGCGLGGFHGGMCDTFRRNTEYQFMTGGQFVAHPGNVIDYRVEMVAAGDPLLQGIGDFDYRSEQYYMHVDPRIEVLATTTFSGEHAPWVAGTRMPVVWKHRHGRGRVFYSALGHKAAEFDHPQMKEILRRGLLWAARDDN
ncbi:ThuA domain-containing protein [Mangrovicoccus algicola]|uniref:ThuA domain-containing protein n=1 Tax=Mangrovicoccus algicola TaxID=2771008 RepID=A0A8J7CVB5_9RHOB|nr:ThuA domain-containing protein [Mangrovicoccus algicola]MBE3638549.1 ThuA domain-containing protein [Mangrovicoccus algicola]